MAAVVTRLSGKSHQSRRASSAACSPQRRTQAPPTRVGCVLFPRDLPNVPRPSRSGFTNPPPTRRGARFSSGFGLPSLIEKGMPNRRPRVADPTVRSLPRNRPRKHHGQGQEGSQGGRRRCHLRAACDRAQRCVASRPPRDDPRAFSIRAPTAGTLSRRIVSRSFRFSPLPSTRAVFLPPLP